MYRSLKGYIIFAVIAVIAAFMVYSQYIAKELERESEMVSRVYGSFCARATEDETSVIFDEIITKINFPVIVTSPNGKVIGSRNVKVVSEGVISALDRTHKPVRIEYQGKLLAFVHYGSSLARRLLKLAPFIETGLALLLVLIGIIWLYTLKRSEENAIFAGMAKETAHQLGTPISALIGWHELICAKGTSTLGEKDKSIREHFKEDLDRLSSVATRFHKIGSPPEFEPCVLNEVMKKVVEYLRDRISGRVKIIEHYDSELKVSLDRELFSWAIENLIKNSVDAGSNLIKITTKRNKYIKLTVEDNGADIPKPLCRRLFSPGYTTKEYGWGIGLALTKRIVRMHGGKISYQANKGTKGSCFTILLPIR